ncbi:MAG: aldehyde dehydrogenase family protein [Pyrinomonadaceae bacterium]
MSSPGPTKEQPAKPEIVSYDPATGAEIGRVPNLNQAEVAAAVERARAAHANWRRLSFYKRAGYIWRAREIILAELDQLAELISREAGKPALEAISLDLSPSLDLMQYFARNSEKMLRPEKLNIGLFGLMGRSSRVEYQSLGVIGIIAPWNFPWGIPSGEVVMALMAGNTVVLKPSELTPLTGVKLGEIFARAGLPENVLQIVTGDGATGAALIEAGVDKIMFTGSVATGRKVAAAAGERLIPVVLELGGKNPMVVLEDAHLETAAEAAVWGAFANSGQACASVERCYVHESIIDKFTELVVAKTRKIRQAAGTSPESDVGAMSSENQLAIVDDHVSDAVAHGAKARTGGHRNSKLDGWFYEPTVLTGVDQSMKVMRAETFGPVLPIMPFCTEEEAIRLANDSSLGLTANVYTSDIGRGKRVARQIEAGTVMINEVIYTHGIAQTPWGGVKNSGFGRTHGKLGLLEMVSPRHIHINRAGFMPDLWWFGYTKTAGKMFRGLARRFATGSVLETTLVLPQMIKRFLEKKQ